MSLAAACAPSLVEPVRPASAYDLPIVQGSTYLGVIFPANHHDNAALAAGLPVREYWTPTPEDVAKLETSLRGTLEQWAHDPSQLRTWAQASSDQRAYVAREIDKILEHFTEFRRQYIGAVFADGTKRILVNCFPGPRSEPHDEFVDWRQRLVVVEDGGFWYWRIQYNVLTADFSEFSSNGYA